MKSQKGNALSTLKGFTLIELLVVIAIIGILAATVLTSLGGARAKARAVRAKSELSSMRAQMELFQLDAGEYTDGCISDGAEKLLASIRTAAVPNSVVCTDTATEWGAMAEFASGTASTTVCVDWTGQIMEGGTLGGTNGATCQ